MNNLETKYLKFLENIDSDIIDDVEEVTDDELLDAMKKKTGERSSTEDFLKKKKNF